MPQPKKIGRRTFLKYVGVAIAVVASVAGYHSIKKPDKISTYNTSIPTTTTPNLTTPHSMNPVIAEFDGKLPNDVIDKTKILGADGELNDDERKLFDLLNKIHENRWDIEKRFDFTGLDLEKKVIDISVEDQKVSSESGRALDYMSNNFSDVQIGLINQGLDETSFGLLKEIVQREDIKKINPDLVFEMVRLKDYQENKEVLDLVFELYESYKDPFDSMMEEGIRGKRRSSPHLEAVTWIYLDKGKGAVEEILESYTPMKLINNAWMFTNISNNLASDRWNDFDEVTNRLINPILVERYMDKKISYRYTPGEPEGVKSAKQIFKDKKGACYDHGLFGCYSIKKNGYKDSKGLRVIFKNPSTTLAGHIVGLYNDPNDGMYYNFDSYMYKVKIHGPYKTEREAAISAVHGKGLAFYSTHEIDLDTGRYVTRWYW